MSEATFNWDEIDVDEEISAEEQAQSENIEMQTPVGKFLCTVMDCQPIEKSFSKYDCLAAHLKMRIDEVIQIEQPVLDNDGKPLVRNGEPVMKVQNVDKKNQAKVDAMIVGQFLFDDITLYHHGEKDAIKRRRLFVAKQIGIITPNAVGITGKDWQSAPGKQVIVTTEWNTWKDKNTDETKKNVRVGWSGYEMVKGNSAGGSNRATDPDFSNI